MSVAGHISRISIAALAALVLWPQPADAFRCGSRIIKDGMHESEVVRLCGEPVSWRSLGFVTRSVSLSRGSRIGNRNGLLRGRAEYREEVEVTELVFNFGPRKFMRKLRFEGAVLVSIEKMSYGYIEKRKTE